jgi:acyl-coenzyme A thioesterase PaaI-like protein
MTSAGVKGAGANVGRRAATAEAGITDANRRLLAHATTTCLVFEILKETATQTAKGT